MAELFRINGEYVQKGDLIVWKSGDFRLADGVVRQENVKHHDLSTYVLGTDAVTSRIIRDHSIRSADLGAGSVTSEAIDNGSVSSDDLAERISVRYLSVGNTLSFGRISSGVWNGSVIDSDYLDFSGIAGTDISIFTNDAGYITASTSDTLTNKSGLVSMWTNDAGYITAASFAGTAGYVAKFSGSGTAVNSLIFESGSMIGIGTSNPANPLDIGIGGGIRLAAGVPGTTDMVLYNDSGTLIWNGMALGTSSASVSGTAGYIGKFTGVNSVANSAVYETGGNVGIGTTNPATKLDVSGVITATGGSSTDWNGAYSYRLVSAAGISPLTLTLSSNALTGSVADATTASKGIASFNASNFSVTSGAVNTVQDIATTATPTFAGLAASGQIVSSVTTGTSPFAIASTTLVSNLNAQYLNGQLGSYYAAASSVSGTAGYVPYFTSASAIGSSGLYYSGGNVGIGTTAPTATFQINGAPSYAAYSGIMSIRTESGTAKYGMLIESGNSALSQGGLLVHSRSSSITGDTVRISALGTTAPTAFNLLNVLGGETGTGGGVSYFAVRGDGNVGIGTTAPAYKLDVAGTGRFTGQLTSTVTTGTAPFSIASTTLVSNLNAQYLNGQLGSYYAAASSISGTSGYLAKFTGSGTVGNSVIYDDGANVGIGTTSPGAKLALANNVGSGFLDSFSEYQLLLYNYNTAANSYGLGVTGGTMSFNSYGAYSFDWRGTSTRMYINNSGYVGIGTTAPSTNLDVAGSLSLSGGNSIIYSPNGYIDLRPTHSSYGLLLRDYTGSVGAWTNIRTVDAATDFFQISVDTSTLPGFVVQAGGNVGIGTTAPVGKLTIDSGSVLLSNGYAMQWYTSSGNDRTMAYLMSNDVLRLGNDATDGANGIAFYTEGHANAMYINSSGNVGIGTTAPAAALEIYGSSEALRITGTSTGIASTGYLSFYDRSGSRIGYIGDASTVNPGIYLGSDSGDVYVNSGNLLVTNSLGIGTTAPTTDLEVRSGTSVTSGQHYIGQLFNASATAGITMGYYADGSAVSGGLLRSVGSLPLHLGTSSYPQAVTMANSGNVGIGTTAPVSALEVSGNVTLSGGNRTIYTPGGYLGIDPNSASYGIVLRDFGSGSTSFANIRTFDTATDFLQITVNSTSTAEGLVVDDNGYVGIGTTAPSSPFHAYSSSVDGVATFESGDANGGIYLKDPSTIDFGTALMTKGNDFAIHTYAIERFRITSSGNVGIGTTAPSSKLFVQGDLSVANASTGTASVISAGSTGFLTLTSPGSITMNASGGNSLSFSQAGAVRMMVSTSGYVGIGTTAPENALSVSSSSADVIARFAGDYGFSRIAVDNTSDSAVSFMESGTSKWSLGNRSANDSFAIRTGSGQFGTSSDRFVIDTSGKVGIGTTAPSAKLEISGASEGIRMVGASSGNSNTTFLSFYDNSGVRAGYIGDIASTANNMYISADVGDVIINNGNGIFNENVGIGTTAPSAQLHTTGTVRFANFGAGTVSTDSSGNITVSSDERLKDIDGYFTRGLSAIMGIDPISYHWNKKSGLETGDQYSGFSAQNIRSVVPEAVGEDNRGYLTLSDRPILAATVNAIKEQQGMIDGLDVRTDASVSDLGSLEESVNGTFLTLSQAIESNRSRTEAVEKSLADYAAVVESLKAGLSANAEQQLALESLAGEIRSEQDRQKLALDTRTVFLGSNLNAISGRIDSLSRQLIAGNFDAGATFREFDYADFPASGDADSDLESAGYEDGSYTGTYDGSGEFREIRIEKSDGLDLSKYKADNGYLEFDVYMSDADAIRDFVTEFGNGMDSDELQWDKPLHPYFLTGWNHVKLPVSSARETGSVDWSDLDHFRIYFKFAAEEKIAIRNVKVGVEELYVPTDSDKLALDGTTYDLSSEDGKSSAIKAISAKLESTATEAAKTESLSDEIGSLKGRVADLESLTKTLADLADVLDPGNMVYKDADGNLDLGEGLLSAKALSVSGTIEADKIKANSGEMKDLQAGTIEVGDDSSGKGTIQSGDTETKIETTQASKEAKIYVTASGSTQGKELYYDEVSDGESFKVKFDGDSVSKDIDFDWLIIK